MSAVRDVMPARAGIALRPALLRRAIPALARALKPTEPDAALPSFSGGPHSRDLTVRRSPQARWMRLAVDPRDGTVRLTLPGRTALKSALAWAEGQRAWVEQALAELPVPHPIVPGAAIPFEDGALLLDWAPGHPRAIRREGGRLIAGGAHESLAPRVLRWLRTEALRTLTTETQAMASRAGVAVTQVAVGDPKARWGSCSSSGAIRYAWRLILAPPAVRQATVAHEVAHRLHMHHGPEFHAAVARLLGREPNAERAWLRAHGASLYWFGRTF